jgi:hypothetical protein
MNKKLSVENDVFFNCCKICLVSPMCERDYDECPIVLEEIRNSPNDYYSLYVNTKTEFIEKKLGKEVAEKFKQYNELIDGIINRRYIIRPETERDEDDVMRFIVEKY